MSDMDANETLQTFREALRRARELDAAGDDRPARSWARQALNAAADLDAHLRAGGRMPDEWNPDYTVGADPEGPDAAGEAAPLDTWSSASRQHYIDTGEYLRVGEACHAGELDHEECGCEPDGHTRPCLLAPEPVPDFARRLDIARGYYAGVRDATPGED